MMTFEEYLKNNKKDIDEDEMVAAAPASDGVVAPHGTTDADVLGKCDHDNCGGFLKKGCFHIPKPVFKKPLSRLAPEIPGGKKRKKKTWQNVQLVTDAELDRRTLLGLHNVGERTIAQFVKRTMQLADDNEVFVEAIVYWPVDHSFFLKFTIDGKASSFFIHFDFNPRTKRFKLKSDKLLSSAQAKAEFKKILDMPGNSPDNKASANMKLWVVWGSLA